MDTVITFFREDVKRAVWNRGVILGIAMMLGIFIHAMRININYGGNPSTYEIISVAMSLSGFSPFAAIFPVLGYSISFCEEYHSGYLKMILARMSWEKYGLVRILSTGISGGVIMAVPFTFVCLTGYILGVHGTEGLTEGGLYSGTKMWYYLEQYGDWYILTGKVLLGFLFGVLWALVGMAFAVWFCNRYVALLAPFVLYEVMWIMFYSIPVLNPVFLFKGDNLESYPLSGAMQLTYTALAVIAVWLGLKRRVRDA